MADLLISWRSLQVCRSTLGLIRATNITSHADTRPKAPFSASRTPSPSGTSGDRQVIPAECKDGCDCADEVSEQDIEAVMSEVRPSGRGDVDAREERDDCEHEEVYWRCCSLISRSNNRFIVAGGIELAVESRKSFVLIRCDLGSFLRYFVTRREGGEVRKVFAVRSWSQEGNGDCEL